MKCRIKVDGACSGNPGHCDDTGGRVFEVSEYAGIGTNNLAEYWAVIRGLELAIEHGYSDVDITSDALMIVNQVGLRHKCRNEKFKRFLNKIFKLVAELDSFSIAHIYGTSNGQADLLAKRGSRKRTNGKIENGA
jgi:ribonuclease HI